ncbi:MAG: efflux RND transporter periplasmic adaptor subunit [Candidatus Bipolaricaulia bacterium]
MRVRGRSKWIIIAMIIVVLGVGAFYGYQQRTTESEADAALTPLGNTWTVQRGPIIKTIDAFGTVQPDREMNLHSKTSGTIQEIKVNVGDRVKEGDVLATLENTQQQLKLIQAENAFELAKISASERELKEKELNYQAALEEYQNTTLTASFSGEIFDIMVAEGEFVNSNTAVIYLVNRDVMHVEVDIDEVDIKEVSLGQRGLVTFDAFPDKRLPAQVTEVRPWAVDRGGLKVIPVSLQILQSDDEIKPGFSAETEIVVAQKRDVLIVPSESVVEQADLQFVTVVNGDETERVQVEVGLDTGTFAEILSGLNEGDVIVANNFQLFREFQGPGPGGGFRPGLFRGGRPGGGGN